MNPNLYFTSMQYCNVATSQYCHFWKQVSQEEGFSSSFCSSFSNNLQLQYTEFSAGLYRKP